MLVLGSLGRDCDADQCHTVLVIGPRKPVWGYKVIRILWLPLLGLGVYRKDQPVQQSQLLLAPGPREGQQTPKAPGDPPLTVSTCWLPHRLVQSLKRL